MSSPRAEDRFLVDAVIPVHRADRPVVRAVESLFDGGGVPVRAIVVAHNVDPWKITENLGRWADDERVLLVSLQDGIPSPSGPMNLGLSLATAPYVTRLDSDDTLEPGALDRWVRIAQNVEDPADFVIANRSELKATNAQVPPIRGRRQVWLDGAKDRLSYRAAPLGLIRRSTFGDLRFPEGVYSGEDIEFSNHIWFSGANIAVAYGEPGYLVHEDQNDRVTTTRRSVGDEFVWTANVLDKRQPWMRSSADRQAFIVKVLRKNVIDAVSSRLPHQWDDEDARQMRALLRKLYAIEPVAFGQLSRGEGSLIRALGRGDAEPDELLRLAGGARSLRSAYAVLPVDLRHLFSAQGPLRYHLAGSVLMNRWRRGHLRPEKKCWQHANSLHFPSR